MTLLTVASCEGHLTSKLMTAFFPRLNRFYLTGEKTNNRRLRLLEFQEGNLSRLSEIGAGAPSAFNRDPEAGCGTIERSLPSRATPWGRAEPLALLVPAQWQLAGAFSHQNAI